MITVFCLVASTLAEKSPIHLQSESSLLFSFRSVLDLTLCQCVWVMFFFLYPILSFLIQRNLVFHRFWKMSSYTAPGPLFRSSPPGTLIIYYVWPYSTSHILGFMWVVPLSLFSSSLSLSSSVSNCCLTCQLLCSILIFFIPDMTLSGSTYCFKMCIHCRMA